MTTRIALCDASGPLTDLLQRLSGEDGAIWLRNLNKMFRQGRGARTVRNFKDFAEMEWMQSGIMGCNKCFDPDGDASRAHRDFWEKLNQLGAKNIKSQPPSSVPDIDDTVVLTDQEWAQLESEFRRLR